MRLPFCIFKVQGDGSEHFVEAVRTLDAARERVQSFVELWPGDYVIYRRDDQIASVHLVPQATKRFDRWCLQVSVYRLELTTSFIVRLSGFFCVGPSSPKNGENVPLHPHCR